MKGSNFFIVASILAVLLVVFSACDSSDNDTSSKSQSKPSNTSQSTDDSSQTNGSSTDSSVKSDNSGENDGITNDTIANEISENSDSNVGDKEDIKTLSQYSNDQIEYARVWLQLGPNQDINELNVKHIQAGTPLNPDDDTNVSYPEDVIQIYGSRIVDGIVTYSGNGNGTINEYNIPYRWYGGLSRPDNVSVDEIREEMKGIIKNTKLVYIDPGDDGEIIDLIKLLNVH